jgi:hypothetical protein
VTITGCSFIVTVHAPNAPCTTISSSRPSATTATPTAAARRADHAITISAMISTPIAIANSAATISIHAFDMLTGPLGIACGRLDRRVRDERRRRAVAARPVGAAEARIGDA